MSELPEVKIKLAELSNEDLFRMVNEDVIDYGKEEISLAYDELDRRGMLPAPTTEKSPVVSPVGCLLGAVVLIVELLLTHQSLYVDQEFLPLPRAAALAMFVAWVSSYWHGRKLHRTFWKHFLWAAALAVLGSLALWDIPNLLWPRIPLTLAFGIPGAFFAAFLFWVYGYYLPSVRQNTERDRE